MKYLFFILTCFVLTTVQSYSQNRTQKAKPKGTCTINGFVFDSAARAAMPYVTVALLNPKDSTVIDGAISKKNGEFSLNDLPFGVYILKFTFMGYFPEIKRDIKLSPDNPKISLNKIYMKAKAIQMSAVEVSADKENISYKIDRKVVNVAENPAVQVGTAADALQNSGTVTVNSEGNVSLRGSENFQVLIDGKPSLQSGNDVLKSIPASAIESIELITNPSAKYDPDGTAGIINLILKKINFNGLNGNINGSVGTLDKYNTDGNFNYRYDNVNFYSSVQYMSNINQPTSTLTRVMYNSARDTSFLINPQVNRRMTNNNLTGKLGVEYNIDRNKFTSFSAIVNKLYHDRFFPSKMREWSEPGALNNYYINDDDNLIKGYYITLNQYYRQDFQDKGHQVSSNLNVIIWDGTSAERMRKVITDNLYNPIDTAPKLHRADAISRTVMLKYKAEYVHPLTDKSRFEAGYNFDYTQDFSDYLFQDYNNQSQSWLRNDFFSNNTKYYHSINAVYGMYSGELWEINYQLGLRGEYFNRRLFQSSINETYKYDKINLFPTLHILKNFANDQQFQFSYSRRVQCPDVYALNPFPDYADDYVVSIGNPNLMPEFTDSYELNYQKGFDLMFFSVQGYYRYTDNALTRVLRIMQNNQLWITSENVSNQYTAGAEIAANFTPFKGFKINLNGNLYRFSIKNYDNSIDESRAGNVFDGNMSVSYSFSPKTYVQINSLYMGQRYTSDGTMDPTYSIGFTARQKLFDGMLTLILNGRNVLNTMKFRTINMRDNYYAEGANFTEGPVYTLGFSLNINNFERKIRPEDTIEVTNVGASGGY